MSHEMCKRDKCPYKWVPRTHLSLWVLLTCSTDQIHDSPPNTTPLSDSSVGNMMMVMMMIMKRERKDRET